MSRKGLTPVVGAVLLITVTVAASVSAFTFLNEIRLDIQENSEQQIQDQRQDLNNEMDIEYAYNNSDGDIMLSIRNTGKIGLIPKEDGEKIWSLFINGRPAKNWMINDRSGNTISINPQGTIIIDTEKTYPTADNQTSIEILGPKVSDSYVCYYTGSSSSC